MTATDDAEIELDAEQYIKQIVALLNKWTAAYTLGEPMVSDSEYDALYRHLQVYESRYPEYIMSDSPTHTVGSKPPGVK